MTLSLRWTLAAAVGSACLAGCSSPAASPSESVTSATVFVKTSVAATPPSEPATTTVTVTTTPTPSDPEASTPAATEPVATETTMMWEGTATFEHFTVTLQGDEANPATVIEGKAGLPVEVCVTKAVDPNGDGKTRVSLDPWRLEASTGESYAADDPGAYEPAFPSEAWLAEGECASGLLTFDTVGDGLEEGEGEGLTAELVYANGLGDRAVWQFH